MTLTALWPPRGGGIEECRRRTRPNIRLAQTRAYLTVLRRMFIKQLGKLFGHGAAQLLGVHDGHGAAVVASHIVADADCDQLDWRARLDVFDYPAQVTLQVVARIDRQCRIVDRGAIRDHHEDAALLGA